MSIHDKSLLVSLNLTTIRSSRADKEITADVLRDHRASEDAGRWVSRLWPKEAMEGIRSLDGQIRALHYAKTLPWMDKGERIIASRTFTAYTDQMRGFRHQRETLVQGFLDHYFDWIDRARVMRGTSFREEEYPSFASARKRFRFDLAAAPVPHADDFRVTLASEDMDEVRASIQARVDEAEANAIRDLYRRLADPVARLVERLADPEGRFTDATLNALREIVATIPDINVMDDPEVEKLRQLIGSQLCTLNAEGVTNSRSDRSRALTRANNILASMAPWMEAIPEEEEETVEAAA